jgi:hypothetical protein
MNMLTNEDKELYCYSNDSQTSILTGGMGELHMEYVKEGCNTPVKNACKSTNMLQLLKFSFCFYQVFHEYRTYRSYKSYVFGIATFWWVSLLSLLF